MSVASVLTGLGNAIRKKTGGTATLTLEQMTAGLNNIPDNDASDVTVSGATVSIPKGNYLADVSKSVTNQGTKTATLSTSTTSYTIPAGYHSGSGKVSITLEEKSATPNTSTQTITPTSGKVLSKVTVDAIPSDYVKPTATLAEETYTPSTDDQIIEAGTYLSGDQTIAGDANLISANIKSGVSIFGVAGNTNVVDTSAGTATAANILKSKIAFVDGAKVTGTMTNRGTVTPTALNAGESYTIPKGYHSGSGKVTTNTLASQTSGTAVAGDILSGKTAWVEGIQVTGTIGTLAAKTYTPSTSSQTIAAGTYLSGDQTISAVPTQAKSATPTTSAQTITPDTGKFLSSVSVGAIATETKSVTPTTSAQDVTPTSGKYLTKVSVGAISTQTKSATPTTSSQTIKPDSGKYLSSVTVNAIPSTYVPDGYVKPSATKAAATITPGTTNQTIAAGTYLSGAQTIAGDADLVSANIKAGANIFGVAGNANVVNTSAGTATAGDMLSGKIAFVDGAKITGTLPEYSDQYNMSEGVTVGNYVAYKINRGAYTYDSTDDIVYIRSTKEQVATAIGLTAAKIVSGNTILDIAGTGAPGALTSQLVASGMVASGGNGESEAKWSCCRPGFANETYFTKTVESSKISSPTTANRHQVVFTCNKTGTYRFRGHAFAYKGNTGDVGLCRSRVVKSGTEKLLVTSTTGDTIDSFDFTESMTSGYTFRIQTDTWGTSKEDDGWLAAVYVTIETA